MTTSTGPLPAEEKRRLRKAFTGRRAGVPAQRAERWSAAIAERFLGLPVLERRCGILTCLSFGTEPDTWALTERLLELGHSVYASRADPRDGQLHVHRYPCRLRQLAFGLQQPPRGTPEIDPLAIAEHIDLVVVLGLAFDRGGYRLGHGSGYFDRFLGRHAVPSVALAFGLQVVESLPRETHDVPMTAVVTEDEVIRAEGPRWQEE